MELIKFPIACGTFVATLPNGSITGIWLAKVAADKKLMILFCPGTQMNEFFQKKIENPIPHIHNVKFAFNFFNHAQIGVYNPSVVKKPLCAVLCTQKKIEFCGIHPNFFTVEEKFPLCRSLEYKECRKTLKYKPGRRPRPKKKRSSWKPKSPRNISVTGKKPPLTRDMRRLQKALLSLNPEEPIFEKDSRVQFNLAATQERKFRKEDAPALVKYSFRAVAKKSVLKPSPPPSGGEPVKAYTPPLLELNKWVQNPKDLDRKLQILIWKCDIPPSALVDELVYCDIVEDAREEFNVMFQKLAFKINFPVRWRFQHLAGQLCYARRILNELINHMYGLIAQTQVGAVPAYDAENQWDFLDEQCTKLGEFLCGCRENLETQLAILKIEQSFCREKREIVLKLYKWFLELSRAHPVDSVNLYEDSCFLVTDCDFSLLHASFKKHLRQLSIGQQCLAEGLVSCSERYFPNG